MGDGPDLRKDVNMSQVGCPLRVVETVSRSCRDFESLADFPQQRETRIGLAFMTRNTDSDRCQEKFCALRQNVVSSQSN